MLRISGKEDVAKTLWVHVVAGNALCLIVKQKEKLPWDKDSFKAFFNAPFH